MTSPAKLEAELGGGRPFGGLFGNYGEKEGKKEQCLIDPTSESKQTV